MSTAHANNAGFLRLVLASAVIIGHAPELAEGSRKHELMTMLFHTMSMGEMAVAGFFLLSGYLVTASLLRSTSLVSYFFKRLLRIYPGFWLASLVLAFGMGPAVGMPPDSLVPLRLLALAEPPACHLHYLHYPMLDGAMWTLAYEIRCYALIALLSVLGFFRNRWLCLGVALALAAAVSAQTFTIYSIWADFAVNTLWKSLVFGLPTWGVNLTSCFLLGGTAYLFSAELNRLVTGWVALACAALAVICLYHPHYAETGFQLFGGLVLYWLAFRARLGWLGGINNSWDISYGTYLYGWPVSLALLIWVDHTMPFPLLALLTLPLSYALGAASWHGVEKHALALAHRDSVTSWLTASLARAAPCSSKTPG